MKQKSRTEYSVMNTSVAFVAQVSAILMGFFTRVVFTRMLSEGYVGINGLFTDILNILSLSELGVGTAITYALYAPIAKGDIKKQQILMRMFRTFYRMTALFVMAAGLCLIPFLDILMKDRPDVDHLVLNIRIRSSSFREPMQKQDLRSSMLLLSLQTASLWQITVFLVR